MTEVASSDTCTIGCKLPNGFLMQAYKMEETHEPVLGGGSRKIKVAVPVNMQPIRIRGNGAPQGGVARGYVDGGYALTHGVSYQIAQEWFKANKDSALVKNKIVILHANERDAAAEARELSEVRSGLERLDPTMKSQNGQTVPSDYRWPRKASPNLSDLQGDTK